MRINVYAMHDLKFDIAKNSVLNNLKTTIQRQGIMLSSYIKEHKLSSQVLNVKTGRLRNSIHSSFFSTTHEFKSIVETNVKYAGVHEYGFQGTVNVRAHKRRISKAWGKPISTRDIIINSFKRNMNMHERSYMRTALREREATIIKAIDLSIDLGMNLL